MSEEKMYAIKNDEGDWADTHYVFGSSAWVTPDKNMREEEAKHNGGHVVTLIEEPEKVVLTKEQAGIVEEAKVHRFPAAHISNNVDDSKHEEELLMNAYVNGYTVATEKKYVVYKNLGGKHNTNGQYAQAYKSANHSKTFSWIITSWVLNGSSFQFTEAEIEHYGLQGCERVKINTEE